MLGLIAGTVIYFGDSISLGVIGNMPVDSMYVIMHSPGNLYLYDPGFTTQPLPQQGSLGWNDGYSTTQLEDATAALPQNAHYRFIIFNSGIHDMQRQLGGVCNLSLGNNVNTVVYHENLEALAYLYGQAANKVVWVNTTNVPPNNVECVDPNDVPIYNAIGQQVAAEHGFYTLTYPQEPYAATNDIHFTFAGYQAMGQVLDTCIVNLINGASCQ